VKVICEQNLFFFFPDMIHNQSFIIDKQNLMD